MAFLVKSGSLTVVARTAVDAKRLVEQLQQGGKVAVTDLNHRDVDLQKILSDESSAEE